MEYTISEYLSYDAEEIRFLYESVGWMNYTARPEMLKKAFENSLAVFGAYEEDRLIGIIRAVGDGASIVFIQDLLVLPEYQRRGIGSALLKKVLEQYKGVYQIELMTDNEPGRVGFYKAAGFVKADEIGCCAFMKMFFQ